MAFATYEDVEARWRFLSLDERTKVTCLLDDAAVILGSKVAVDPTDEAQAAALKLVSCGMVVRAMVAAASDAFGVGELTATMGPFSQTASYANPNGDLYLTKEERRLLGVVGGGGRVLMPSYASEEDDDA
jgi:hypothetical protein